MVTFETAVRLKEAGFPQPATKHIQTRQFWYSQKGDLCVVTYNRAQWSFRVTFFDYPTGRGGYIQEGKHVFAPAATDILKDAKGLYLSPMMQDDWGVFVIGGREMVGYHHEDPAEACAEAWLKINKK